MFMHDFLRFVIVSFVFVSAVSCLVSVRDMRAAGGLLSAWWWRYLYWMEGHGRRPPGRPFCRLRPFALQDVAFRAAKSRMLRRDTWPSAPGKAAAGSYGYAVCPYTPITV